MQACYHDQIVFSDPVFLGLKGNEAKAMWHMLIEAGKDLSIQYKNIQSQDSAGECDWDAHYTFSRTGRKVHNIIHAKFEFSDGKIIKHTDSFDLWRWSGMALGITGILLGWSPLIRTKIRAAARKNLMRFIQEHKEIYS